MEDLTGRFKTYVLQTLDLNVPLSKLKESGPLPFLLLNTYDIHQVSLLEKDFIVLIAKHNEELTPATIQKHIDMVNEKLGMRSIFVDASISSFNRKRLIEYKVPFVIPGNQMYLPDLGIDLREHFSKKNIETRRVRAIYSGGYPFCAYQHIERTNKPDSIGRSARVFTYGNDTLYR